MSQDINDPKFKQLCKSLWEDLAPYTTVDDFREELSSFGKTVHLGKADVTLGIATASGHISEWKLRNIEVKFLNGKLHLDMPGDKGADGNYYPLFFPKTPADRAVLTTIVFADARVIKTINSITGPNIEVSDSVDITEPNTNSGTYSGFVIVLAIVIPLCVYLFQ